MAIDSARLLDAYLKVDPGIRETIAETVQDLRLRDHLIDIFTGHAGTEDAINEVAQFLIEWAADQKDSRLVILVFCAAITNMDTEVEPSLAQTLLGLAKSRIKPETDDALVALFHFADALIKREGGATDHFEIVFATGLMLLDKSHPLWQDKLRIFALHLAYRGRLAEIARLIPGLEANGLHDLEDLALATPWEMVALFDCIEAGRLALAGILVDRLSEREDVGPSEEEIIGGYEAQALLMRHVLSRSLSTLPAEVLDDDQCQRLSALATGDIRQIHELIEHLDYDEVLTPSGLYGYTAIRMSLALRDHALAADLLTRRQEAGFGTYLDDFFLARIALLNGESTKAAEHFGRVLRAVEFYEAHNRLEFELYLSCEIAPIQMTWLGHRIDFSQTYEPPANAFNRAHHRTRDLTTFHRHTAAVDPDHELGQRIRRHCDADLPCLVLGPAGAGHFALARQLHEESSRHGGTLQTVLSGVVADADLQLLFFGDAGGDPGLLQQVAGGTLVVQDVEDASPALQAVLEHVLQLAEVPAGDATHPKLVATTRASMTELRQRLRPALYHRLQVMPIELPPLRDRQQRLGDFAVSILQDTSLDSRVQVSLAPSLLTTISTYEWPGNIDEFAAFLQGLWLQNPQQNHFTIENAPSSWRALLLSGREDAGGDG